MKEIKRHKLNIEDLEWFYEELPESLNSALENAKENYRFLDLLRKRVLEAFYIALVLNKPKDASEYIYHAYRGYKGEFSLKSHSGEAVELELEEGEKVTFTY